MIINHAPPREFEFSSFSTDIGMESYLLYELWNVEMNRESHEPIDHRTHEKSRRNSLPSTFLVFAFDTYVSSFLSFLLFLPRNKPNSGWNVIDAFEVSLPRPSFEWVECRGCAQLSPTPPPSPVSAVPIAGRTSFCFLEKIKIPPA